MDPVFVPLNNQDTRLKVPQGSKLSTYLDRGCDAMLNGANSQSISAGAGGGVLSRPVAGSRLGGGSFLPEHLSQPPPLCRALSQPPPTPPALSSSSLQHQPPALSGALRSCEPRHDLFRQDSAGGVFYQKNHDSSEISSVSSLSPPTVHSDPVSLTRPSSQQHHQRVAAPPPSFITPPPSAPSHTAAAAGAAVSVSVGGSGVCGAGVISLARPYVSNEARDLLLAQQASVETRPAANNYPDVPAELDNYHELCALEPCGQSFIKSSSTAGIVSTCFKATNMKTGQRVCLRRIHGHRLSSTKALQMVHLWRRLNHTNLVSLRELFTTKCFGDNSVMFVYDFYPGVETLLARHFSRSAGRRIISSSSSAMSPSCVPSAASSLSTSTASSTSMPTTGASLSRHHLSHNDLPPHKHSNNGLIVEGLLWSYIIQLTSVLRMIHTAGLACRTLDPSKVLVSGADRIHLNGCGVLDVLMFDSSTMSNHMTMMSHYQQQDLVNLGKLLLVLACNSLLAVQRDSINTSIGIVERHYSSDLKSLIVNLLMSSSASSSCAGSTSGTSSVGCRSIGDVMPLIGARFYLQLDSSMRLADRLCDELHQAAVASPLFSLLAKLTVLTERSRRSDRFQRGVVGCAADDRSHPRSLLMTSSSSPLSSARQSNCAGDAAVDDEDQASSDGKMLSMLRHYLFHALADTDQPYLCLGHCVSVLHKLDAGCDEKICLISGDTETVVVASYGELRECFERAQSRLAVTSTNNINTSSGPHQHHYTRTVNSSDLRS